MTPIKVAILGRIHQQALSLLKENSRLQVDHFEESKIHADLAGYEGLIIRSATRIGREELKILENLKYLVTATSGFDHIDYQECKEQKIVCDYCPDANAQSAAELTFAHLLSLMRRLHISDEQVRQGQWRSNLHLGGELYDKKIFIIGLGRIGKKVAAIANGFAMHVFFYDPYVGRFPPYEKLETLQEGIRLADIVSLHTPKTRLTSPLLNTSHASLFDESKVLLNMARGDALEDRLIDMLVEKNVAIALDVYPQEPPKLSDTWVNSKRTSFSPHIGAYTEAAFQRSSMAAAKKLTDFFSGRNLGGSLPPQAAWVQDVD